MVAASSPDADATPSDQNQRSAIAATNGASDATIKKRCPWRDLGNGDP
jgi:hypothetical protein